MSATFLVTGATGQQGGATTRELLKAGARVHALVRDTSKPAAKELEALGVVLFQGDYSNAEAITKATVGVKGIFLNPFPEFGNPDAERAQIQRFVDAGRAAGTVDTLVLTTAVWAAFHEQWLDEDPPMKAYTASKCGAEAAVRGAGFKYYTIFRAPWLLHNYAAPVNAVHFPEFPSIGEIHSPINVDLPLAHLDPYDIGRFATAALLDPERFAGKELPLTAGNFSMRDVARELEVVIGAKIPVVQLDPADFLTEQSSFMSRMRGLSATWTNLKGITVTEEQLALQKSFGIETTPLRAGFERLRASLPAKQE